MCCSTQSTYNKKCSVRFCANSTNKNFYNMMGTIIPNSRCECVNFHPCLYICLKVFTKCSICVNSTNFLQHSPQTIEIRFKYVGWTRGHFIINSRLLQHLEMSMIHLIKMWGTICMHPYFVLIPTFWRFIWKRETRDCVERGRCKQKVREEIIGLTKCFQQGKCLTKEIKDIFCVTKLLLQFVI